MAAEIEIDDAVPARTLDQRAQVLSALGDVNRLAVVDLLQVQDLSPDAIAAALQIPGNLLAHHLKILEAADIIDREPSQNDRRRTYVRLVHASLLGLLPAPSELATPRVVFVCTHNSARSVLADALWRDASDIPSTSAGTHPVDRINPRAKKAARRQGLTIEQKAPQSIDDVLRPDDVVVSVCDSVNEELGPLPNTHVHWSVPDPARLDTDEAFTQTIEDLRGRVDLLVPVLRPHRYTTKRSSR
jgi:protein-tyrosine-phosphatase/DNA-binding HxlR family transcriptional regulator